jgi:hypothetical protein
MDLPDQGLSTPREAVLPRYCRYRHRHTLHLENDDDRRFPIPDQKVDGKDGSREPDPPHGREGVHYSGVSDGTCAILLSPMELVEKISALVAPTAPQLGALPWHPRAARQAKRESGSCVIRRRADHWRAKRNTPKLQAELGGIARENLWAKA